MQRTIFNYLIIFILLSFQPINIVGQSIEKDKKVQKFENWHNADLKKNKKNGVSTDLAYAELLSGKKSTTIIVAVIDGGVDIFHEDLKDVIWTNPKEIPNNGIDDDNNGYIDDVHGWNFLGVGKKGTLIYESLEVTREYKRLNQKYGKKLKSQISASDSSEFQYFLNVKTEFLTKKAEAEEMLKIYTRVKEDWEISEIDVKKFLNKDTITLSDLKDMKAPLGTAAQYSGDYLLKLMTQGATKQEINSAYEHFYNQYNYQYNLDYNGRAAIGDDPDNFKDTKYGNNDVKGDRPSHGTFVSGLIAAKRNNNIGINGVADNVRIMPLIAVPDGDERDKDVALAIRYATDNGAKIINMSFGKTYSPHKKEVLEALEYAASHNVLLVHAAGNDAENNDSTENYPSVYQFKNNSAISSFIEVGASTIHKNKKIPADFSNYGALSVDIFAPGEDVYSTNPENTYDVESGTSFACPVVAGIGALVWSYYPNLTAKQIKEILIKSGVSFADKKVLRPSSIEKAPKIEFGKLSISGKVVNAYQALKLAEQY